jgi:murein DD-endopeptidase MepM/ murein hydrolase activator NlpD
MLLPMPRLTRITRITRSIRFRSAARFVLLTTAVAAVGLMPRPQTARAAPAVLVRARAPVSYAPPISSGLDVVRPFDPPSTRYGPGHLGVDVRTGPVSDVRAAGDGTVRFAGSVAGRGVVVVLHADGITTEYEPVRPLVVVGAEVQRGQVIGRVAGRHRGCSGWCLHWGARRGTVYLDPLALLRPLGPVRLLPWARDG